MLARVHLGDRVDAVQQRPEKLARFVVYTVFLLFYKRVHLLSEVFSSVNG